MRTKGRLLQVVASMALAVVTVMGCTITDNKLSLDCAVEVVVVPAPAPPPTPTLDAGVVIQADKLYICYGESLNRQTGDWLDSSDTVTVTAPDAGVAIEKAEPLWLSRYSHTIPAGYEFVNMWCLLYTFPNSVSGVCPNDGGDESSTSSSGGGDYHPQAVDEGYELRWALALSPEEVEVFLSLEQSQRDNFVSDLLETRSPQWVTVSSH